MNHAVTVKKVVSCSNLSISIISMSHDHWTTEQVEQTCKQQHESFINMHEYCNMYSELVWHDISVLEVCLPLHAGDRDMTSRLPPEWILSGTAAVLRFPSVSSLMSSLSVASHLASCVNNPQENITISPSHSSQASFGTRVVARHDSLQPPCAACASHNTSSSRQLHEASSLANVFRWVQLPVDDDGRWVALILSSRLVFHSVKKPCKEQASIDEGWMIQVSTRI